MSMYDTGVHFFTLMYGVHLALSSLNKTISAKSILNLLWKAVSNAKHDEITSRRICRERGNVQDSQWDRNIQSWHERWRCSSTSYGWLEALFEDHVCCDGYQKWAVEQVYPAVFVIKQCSSVFQDLKTHTDFLPPSIESSEISKNVAPIKAKQVAFFDLHTRSIDFDTTRQNFVDFMMSHPHKLKNMNLCSPSKEVLTSWDLLIKLQRIRNYNLSIFTYFFRNKALLLNHTLAVAQSSFWLWYQMIRLKESPKTVSLQKILQSRMVAFPSRWGACWCLQQFWFESRMLVVICLRHSPRSEEFDF